MTIPTSVYQSAKVSQDLSASQRTIDRNATIRSGIQSGKGFLRQIWEYFRLRRGPGRLEMNDYYLYRLYDDSKYTFAQKQEFVSESFYFQIIENCCDKRWWILADDKFWGYTVLEANGFPVPKTQAAYCNTGRVFGGVPTLTTTDDLHRFLSDRAVFPLYSKPVNGIASFGNYLIERYKGGMLHLHDGSQMGLDRFATEIDAGNGQLLQSTLTSHPNLADVCGRVSTVRVILIIQNGKPKVLHTVWKVPAKENMADNFWRDGNRLAAIDLKTGEVQRVVGHQNGVPEELDPNAPEVAKVLGRRLPDWDGVIDLCVRGSLLFAPLRFQSWDIALTEKGPVVVEFNPGSAFNLSQLATGKGFLTDEFLDFLRECGCKLKSRVRHA